MIEKELVRRSRYELFRASTFVGLDGITRSERDISVVKDESVYEEEDEEEDGDENGVKATEKKQQDEEKYVTDLAGLYADLQGILFVEISKHLI